MKKTTKTTPTTKTETLYFSSYTDAIIYAALGDQTVALRPHQVDIFNRESLKDRLRRVRGYVGETKTNAENLQVVVDGDVFRLVINRPWVLIYNDPHEPMPRVKLFRSSVDAARFVADVYDMAFPEIPSERELEDFWIAVEERENNFGAVWQLVGRAVVE